MLLKESVLTVSRDGQDMPGIYKKKTINQYKIIIMKTSTPHIYFD